MKGRIHYLTLTVLILLISAPAWSYDAKVGSIWFDNHLANVYDSTGTLWLGDDFNNSAPMTPPYTMIDNPNSNSMSVSGGLLNVSLQSANLPNMVKIGLPNFDSSHNWQTIQNSALVMNYQAGPPSPGAAFF